MSKKKILVVDDSMFFLQVMKDFLEKMGYAVIIEDNAGSACRLLESEQFDLIFTDLNMPGTNGVEFAQRVKKLPTCRFTPVVMLSASENEPMIEFARRSGISLFLPKPINEERLRKILEIVVGGSEKVTIENAG